MAQHHHDMPELMWQCRTSPSVLAADNFSLPLKIPTHLKFRDKPKKVKYVKGSIVLHVCYIVNGAPWERLEHLEA